MWADQSEKLQKVCSFWREGLLNIPRQTRTTNHTHFWQVHPVKAKHPNERDHLKIIEFGFKMSTLEYANLYIVLEMFRKWLLTF